MIPPQIPASIVREDVWAFCREIGLEPNDLQSLRIEYYGLHARLTARSDTGQLLAAGDEVATHEVFVPFADREAGKP